MSFNISISVHDLVDFVLRSGDIDTRIFNNATMLEGTRIHRYYQAKMDKDYKSEVFLSFNCEYDEFSVHNYKVYNLLNSAYSTKVVRICQISIYKTSGMIGVTFFFIKFVFE